MLMLMLLKKLVNDTYYDIQLLMYILLLISIVMFNLVDVAHITILIMFVFVYNS